MRQNFARVFGSDLVLLVQSGAKRGGSDHVEIERRDQLSCSSRALTNSKDGCAAGIRGEERVAGLVTFSQVEAVLATRGQCPQQDSNLRHTV